MNIILTGTGASQNIPAFRCCCSVCEHARNSGKKEYIRKNSSAVVTLAGGSEKIMIDAPPHFMGQLEDCAVDDREISSLFLTHRHDDHLLGLFYLFSLKTTKGAEINNPLDLYFGRVTGEYLYKKFKSLTNPEKMKQMEGIFNFISIEDRKEFYLGDCRIVPLETNHLKMKSSDPAACSDETLGFCFSEDSKNLFYLVDAAEKLPEQTLLFMKKNKPDYIIIDCTYDEGSSDSGHGDIQSVLELKKMFPDSGMIISHISHKNYTPDVLEKILMPYGIEVGYDGMEINL